MFPRPPKEPKTVVRSGRIRGKARITLYHRTSTKIESQGPTVDACMGGIWMTSVMTARRVSKILRPLTKNMRQAGSSAAMRMTISSAKAKEKASAVHSDSKFRISGVASYVTAGLLNARKCAELELAVRVASITTLDNMRATQNS